MTITEPTTDTITDNELGQLVWMDPRELLIDRNIRDAKLDKRFVASIRDYGILEPIIAVTTEDGQVRVRFGERRTLGAIKAERFSVPVFIRGREDDDEVTRIATQYEENDKRRGLTVSEEVGVYEQLALAGLPAHAIAAQLHTGRKEVQAGLAVSESEAARAAVTRHGFLTFEQGAILARHDDTPAVVRELIVAAKEGDVQFARAAAEADRALAERQAYQAVLDSLTENGVTMLDDAWRRDWLDNLCGEDGEALDEAVHAQCPGHAAIIVTEWYAPEGVDPDRNLDDSEDGDDGSVYGPHAVYVCTDPDEHGHRHPNRFGTASVVETEGGNGSEFDEHAAELAQAEAERKQTESEQRKLVLTNNKAWRENEPIRRDWLRSLAERRTPPKGAAAFVAEAIIRDADVLNDGLKHSDSFAFAVFDATTDDDLCAHVEAETDARAQLVTLTLVLAAYENATNVYTWRYPRQQHRRYFRWLADNGYPLSDVETLAAGTD